jgi:PAS domain S-box-containing protein
MRLDFNRTLQIGYGISIFMLIIVGAISYRTVRQLLESNHAVEHSNLIIQKLEKAISVMKDAETGQRGYLLTGRTQFLEPYNGAYRQASSLVDEVALLTRDNALQQRSIRAIRTILLQRMTILQALIDLKRQGKPITAADLGAGKSAMDALRQAINQSENDEQVLLDQRISVLKRYASLTPLFIVLAILIGVLISVLSYVRVIRDIRTKDRLRAELELKEQETAAFNEELTAANEEIVAANEELTAINEELSEAREEIGVMNLSLEKKVENRTRALQASKEETQALNEELRTTNEELAAANEQYRAAIDELLHTREQSAKLAAIVESSDDAIISKTLDGQITSWNQAAERLFGYTAPEMIGQSILRLIPEERWDEEPQIIARLKKGERMEHFETQRITSDGQLLDLSLTISPIRDTEGRVVGVSKIARDISERKQDEARKNDFIGMVSHELKTPLTSIAALVQLLNQKLTDYQDQFIPSALSKTHIQVRKMTSMINGFLNVSRLESGKIHIDKQPFDLQELIHEVVDESRLIISSHSFEIVPGASLPVEADRDKIGSVISNLLSNAVKYSPGGKLVIVQYMLQDGNALVGVQDEGIGIDPGDLDKLFGRFYRVSSSDTRHIAGFGIGLYLSAEIIKRHGGKIWAESEKSLGSTFYFSLPLT